MKQKLTFLLTALLLLLTNAIPSFGQYSYEKVTSTPTSWEGEYLLVYEADATTAYSWTGVDAASCYAEMTISGNTITATNPVTITVASMTDGYSILVNGGTNDGKYIYGQSGSNIIKFGTDPELNTLECETDGVKITSYTSVMRFNSASNNLRFRYFKSTSYTNQQVVQLYKKVSGSTPTPYFTAEDVEIEYDATSGAIEYTVNNPVTGGTVSASTTSFHLHNQRHGISAHCHRHVELYVQHQPGGHQERYCDAGWQPEHHQQHL